MKIFKGINLFILVIGSFFMVGCGSSSSDSNTNSTENIEQVKSAANLTDPTKFNNTLENISVQTSLSKLQYLCRTKTNDKTEFFVSMPSAGVLEVEENRVGSAKMPGSFTVDIQKKQLTISVPELGFLESTTGVAGVAGRLGGFETPTLGCWLIVTDRNKSFDTDRFVCKTQSTGGGLGLVDDKFDVAESGFVKWIHETSFNADTTTDIEMGFFLVEDSSFVFLFGGADGTIMENILEGTLVSDTEIRIKNGDKQVSCEIK